MVVPDEFLTPPTPSGPAPGALPSTQPGRTSVGIIAGSALGGLAGICLVVLAAILYRKRTVTGDDESEVRDFSMPEPEPVMYQTAPFELDAALGLPPEGPIASKFRLGHENLQFPGLHVVAPESANTAPCDSENGGSWVEGNADARDVLDRDESGWRAEVEMLRRAVQALQRERPDPPPEYRSEAD